MPATSSFEYALDYLETQDAYALGPFFAAHIYTGTAHNNAIDAYVQTVEAVEELTKDFKEAGWQTEDEQFIGDAYARRTVKTGGITLTVRCTYLSRHVWLATQQTITYDNRQLQVITPEALFLILWNQITWQDRSLQKTEQDRTILSDLRALINIQKMLTIMEYLPDTYWRDGKA